MVKMMIEMVMILERRDILANAGWAALWISVQLSAGKEAFFSKDSLDKFVFRANMPNQG